MWRKPASTWPPWGSAHKLRNGEPAQKKVTSERVREFGNPAAYGRPVDLEICELAAMEEKLTGVLCATDEWVEPEWDENVTPYANRLLNDMQKDVDKSWA